MVYKIHFTRKAVADLETILEYIRAGNPAAADDFGSSLLDYVDLLRTLPRIGVWMPGRMVRKLIHTPVRIYYRIDERSMQVNILRLWHTARKEPKL